MNLDSGFWNLKSLFFSTNKNRSLKKKPPSLCARGGKFYICNLSYCTFPHPRRI